MSENENEGRILRYKSMQNVITEIFLNCGFQLVNSDELKKFAYEVNVEKDGVQYAFAVKQSRKINASDNGVLAAANDLLKLVIFPLKGRIPILVIIGMVSLQIREKLAESHPKLIVIDIQNLLHMVQGEEELRNRLVTQLLFSVEGVKLIEPDLPITLRKKESSDSIWDKYIYRIQAWKPSDETSQAYEDTCCEILKSLFAEDLAGWWEQETSNAELFRMDMIAKIKHGRKTEFWETAERHFNSKYIVFEYKNYSRKITQAQVFTTVKYLYAKALRTIAILISPEGPDENAQKAIRGCLREDGKLIIALTHNDLIQMLRKKRDGDDPSDHLSEILDALLIDLEK
ncbi:MAG: hypothetical protein IKY17_06785 [Oscillospiraceae bacterium]|nr:hypothetical protein [Oscillospiraceae bacterium]